jgi:hypothetical protein
MLELACYVAGNSYELFAIQAQTRVAESCLGVELSQVERSWGKAAFEIESRQAGVL